MTPITHEAEIARLRAAGDAMAKRLDVLAVLWHDTRHDAGPLAECSMPSCRGDADALAAWKEAAP